MSKNNKKDIYDCTERYQADIAPLVQKLKVLCGSYRIPMFFTAAIKNDEHGTTYVKECLLAATGIRPTEDRIRKLIMKTNGCSASPPRHITEAIKTLEEYLDSIRYTTPAPGEETSEKITVYSEPDNVADVTEAEYLADINLIASMEAVDIEIPDDSENGKDALLAGDELFDAFEDSDDIILGLSDADDEE